MKKQYIFILILISFALTNVIAYLDEGIRTFDYLTRIGDWIALIMYTFIFSVIPLVLFFAFRKSKSRFLIALSGFLPVLYLIFNQLTIS